MFAYTKGTSTADFFDSIGRNDYDAVHRYLDEGFGANCHDDEGTSVLMYAAFGNHEEIVRLLVARGADINRRDIHGVTALYYAVWDAKDESIVRILLDAGAEPNGSVDGWIMYKAVVDVTPSVVKLLIERGADVNIKGPRPERTKPLMMAVRIVGDITDLELLLSAGADPDAVDSRGATALMHAMRYEAPLPFLDALYQAGANICIRDRRWRTALHYAKEQNYADGVEWIKANMR